MNSHQQPPGKPASAQIESGSLTEHSPPSLLGAGSFPSKGLPHLRPFALGLPYQGEEGKGGRGFHSLQTIAWATSGVFSILCEKFCHVKTKGKSSSGCSLTLPADSRQRHLAALGSREPGSPCWVQQHTATSLLPAWQQQAGKQVRFPWHCSHTAWAKKQRAPLPILSAFLPNPFVQGCRRNPCQLPKKLWICAIVENDLGEAVTTAVQPRATLVALTKRRECSQGHPSAAPSFQCRGSSTVSGVLRVPACSGLPIHLKLFAVSLGTREKTDSASFISAHESRPNLSSLYDYG